MAVRESTFRRRLLWAVAVVVLVFAALGIYVKVVAAVERARPAAAAPPDLCAAVGTSLFEKLVPEAVPLADANYSSGPGAACDYVSARGGSGSEMYGSLHVRLLRHGQVNWDTGSERAAAYLADLCRATAMGGKFSATTAFGDEACAVSTVDGGGTAYASAVVRLGADLLSVNYYVHPGGAAQAQRAVEETVAAALEGVR
ncbi:hypothetical protein [Nocardia sp. NPDC057668]|uniref:hypothetical protein n=1 Tax=Nocardia sp. NPDC057668 TaxID=3346202 RepID=UPI00366CCB05